MKWTFRQIEGVNRKVLELDGYAAPFGRPRKDPVIKEIIKSRVQTTKYPGKRGAPTRHAFGVDWEPTDIKGRWATKHLEGSLTAGDMADQWTDFVSDESLVELSWGSIVSYIVYIDEIEFGRESEDDIAWKMHLLVDERTNNVSVAGVSYPQPTLIDNTEAALQTLVGLSKLKPPPQVTDGLGFFDSLSLLIGELNSFPAALNKLVNQVGNIETATFGALNALRAGVKGFQTTIISARELATTLALDSANFARSAKSDLQWAAWKSTFDVESDVLLSILADLDTRAEIGATTTTPDGNTGKVVTAISDDTWESLSTRATGGPDAAPGIRAANGIRYGQRPEPGVSYLIASLLSKKP